MLQHNPPCEPFPMCERLLLWRHHVQISCWMGFLIMLKMQLSRGLKNMQMPTVDNDVQICHTVPRVLAKLLHTQRQADLFPSAPPRQVYRQLRWTGSLVSLRQKFANFFFTRGREDETVVVEMVLKQRSGKLQKLWDLFAIPSSSENTPSSYSTMCHLFILLTQGSD